MSRRCLLHFTRYLKKTEGGGDKNKPLPGSCGLNYLSYLCSRSVFAFFAGVPPGVGMSVPMVSESFLFSACDALFSLADPSFLFWASERFPVKCGHLNVDMSTELTFDRMKSKCLQKKGNASWGPSLHLIFQRMQMQMKLNVVISTWSRLDNNCAWRKTHFGVLEFDPDIAWWFLHFLPQHSLPIHRRAARPQKSLLVSSTSLPESLVQHVLWQIPLLVGCLDLSLVADDTLHRAECPSWSWNLELSLPNLWTRSLGPFLSSIYAL